MKLWEVSTGVCLYTWEFPTAVKRVAFNEDDSQVVCVTEQRMGYQSAIRVFNVNRDGDGRDRTFNPIMLFSRAEPCLILESATPVFHFNPVGSKATVVAFGVDPTLILTGHESGKVALWDAKSGEEIMSNEHAHRDVVTDLQLHPDQTYFITSSKDKTARVGFIFHPFSKDFFFLMTPNF